MIREQRDREMVKLLDQVVLWFGTEKTIEILEDYNEDFEGSKREDIDEQDY